MNEISFTVCHPILLCLLLCVGYPSDLIRRISPPFLLFQKEQKHRDRPRSPEASAAEGGSTVAQPTPTRTVNQNDGEERG